MFRPPLVLVPAVFRTEGSSVGPPAFGTACPSCPASDGLGSVRLPAKAVRTECGSRCRRYSVGIATHKTSPDLGNMLGQTTPVSRANGKGRQGSPADLNFPFADHSLGESGMADRRRNICRARPAFLSLSSLSRRFSDAGGCPSNNWLSRSERRWTTERGWAFHWRWK